MEYLSGGYFCYEVFVVYFDGIASKGWSDLWLAVNPRSSAFPAVRIG